jgi:hypothetical protein
MNMKDIMGMLRTHIYIKHTK